MKKTKVLVVHENSYFYGNYHEYLCDDCRKMFNVMVDWEEGNAMEDCFRYCPCCGAEIVEVTDDVDCIKPRRRVGGRND